MKKIISLNYVLVIRFYVNFVKCGFEKTHLVSLNEYFEIYVNFILTPYGLKWPPHDVHPSLKSPNS